MAYDATVVQKIIELSRQGYSSREIATELGINSKSTVNNILNKTVRTETTQLPKGSGPKILLFDLETSAAKVYCFGRHKQFISQDAVVEEGGKILTAAWKWLGEDRVYSYANLEEILSGADATIVGILYELFEQADAVVAHNGLNFDKKMLATRALVNGFGALPTVKHIDTLVMAKKNFRFQSNRLDHLGAYLGLGRKVDTGGISLWVDVQEGSAEALKKMVEYNEQDVRLLEEIYLKLRSFGHSGTNFNAAHYYSDSTHRCASCGSSDVSETGKSVFTALSEFAEVRCNSCGSVHRKRKILNSKESRSKLSLNILN